ncbi:interleukin-10 receptor subunit beta-like [Mustelus asterias]
MIALTLSFLGFVCGIVLGEIREPGNLRIDYVRWKRILKWDSVFFQGGSATYSVQRSFESNGNWTDVQDCTHVAETQCELLDDISSNATYNLRVRAEHRNEMSNWVEAVSEPKNVTVESFNLKHLVKWDPDVYQLGPVTYSVQFQGQFERMSTGNWSDVVNCMAITEMECDLLDSLAFFATYFLRVRTERGGATSHWVEAVSFSPYKDTVIGPPAVRVSSQAGELHVTIADPIAQDGHSMRYSYTDLAYHVFYWIKNEEGTLKMRNKSATASTVLLNLQPWTNYCLKVQAYSLESSKQGLFSPVICEHITANSKTRAIAAAQVLFITLIAVLVVTLGCFFFVKYARRAIKYLMYPSYSLPVHIQEYLTEPIQQPLFETLNKEDLREEHWDKLSIVSHTEIPPVPLNSTETDGSKSDKTTTKSDGKILIEEDDVQSSQSSVDSGHYSNSTENSSRQTSQSLEDASRT